MIELSRHIEALLLTHDCVIVPGLGGFVTQYVPAYHVEEENLFIPPHRTIAFNAGLSLNDGLLVESYMKRSGRNYADAVTLVRQDVEALMAALDYDGQYELQGLGTLTYRMGRTLVFTPAESGAITPLLYGLGAFTAHKKAGATADDAPVANFTATDTVVCDTQADEEITEPARRSFQPGRDLYNYVAAAVVAVVFYFLWATPLGNPQTDAHRHYSAMGLPVATPSTPAATPKPQTADQSAKPQVTKPHVADQGKATTTKKATETETDTTTEAVKPAESRPTEISTPYYAIVLASAITADNAEQYVAELRRQGHTQAEVLTRRKMVRVVYGRYTAVNEAANALKELRQSNNRFEDAWIYEVK